MTGPVTANASELLMDILREVFHGHNEVEHYGLPALWLLVGVGFVVYLLNH